LNWIALTAEQQLEDITTQSYTIPQLIFKHSTRCSISSMAKHRLDKAAIPNNAVCHYLDLIAYRQLSNKIAEVYNVHHESPQVLLISKGACVYDESHSGIDIDEINEQLALCAV
jgi:bacillithiol system protein YtxJ